MVAQRRARHGRVVRRLSRRRSSVSTLLRTRCSQEDDRRLLDHSGSRWQAAQANPNVWDHHRRLVGIVRLAQSGRLHACGNGSNGCLHASPNVTKKVLDWEYTIGILHSDLRTCLRDQLQALPPRSGQSPEGSYSQGLGAPYVQDISTCEIGLLA